VATQQDVHHNPSGPDVRGLVIVTLQDLVGARGANTQSSANNHPRTRRVNWLIQRIRGEEKFLSEPTLVARRVLKTRIYVLIDP
jgi:hypothetical protein